MISGKWEKADFGLSVQHRLNSDNYDSSTSLEKPGQKSNAACECEVLRKFDNRILLYSDWFVAVRWVFDKLLLKNGSSQEPIKL